MTSTRPWKNPVEVPLREMKKRVVIDPEKYAFYKDVEARLSQTISAAIRYEFADRDAAKAYQQYTMGRYRKRHGNGKLRSQIQDADGKTYVYFAPWKRNGADS